MPSEPGGLVVRDHSAAAPPVARIAARARDRAAVLADDARRSGRRSIHARRGARALEHLDARVLDDERRELADDAPAGRAAAGVHDAAHASARPRARARACRGGRRRSARRGARGRATRAGASRARAPRPPLRRTAPRPATLGVGEVAVGRVVGGQRRGERRPGPSSWPSAPAAWRRRARPARPRGRRSARRTGRRRRRRRRRRRLEEHGFVGHRRVPYRGWPPRSCSATPRRSSTTPARIPSSRRGSSAIERALRARDWLGWERARVAARPTGRLLERVHPRALRRLRSRGSARRGGGRDRRGHDRQRGLLARRRCTPRAAPWRWSTRCSTARAPARRRRCTGRPATTPRPTRAMGFCLFNNVAVAARQRAGRPRRRARADPRLGRPPRQRDQRHLPRRPTRCCSARSTSGRCIPGPDRRRTPAAGAGEGFTVNLPVPAGSGDATCLLARRARRRAAGARVRARAGAGLGGLRRARRRPAGRLPVTDAGYAAMAASVRRARRRARRAGRRRARGRLRPRRARALVVGTLEVAAAPAPPAPPDVPVDPLAAEAAQRLAAGRWPALAG